MKHGSKKDDDDEYEDDYDDVNGDEKRCGTLLRLKYELKKPASHFRFTGTNAGWTSQPGRYCPIADISSKLVCHQTTPQTVREA